MENNRDWGQTHQVQSFRGLIVTNRLSRKIVIDWAVKVADKEGIESVTLTRVANDLGVSQPALYRHVGGIGELRKALTLRARELLAKDLLKSTSGLAGKEAVSALAYAWRRGASFHPGLLTLPGQVKILGDVELEASVERIVAIIGQTLSAFDLDEEARVQAALLVRSMLHGFSAIEAMQDGQAGHSDDSFEQMITLVWIGLQSFADVSSEQYSRIPGSASNGLDWPSSGGGTDFVKAGPRRSKANTVKSGGGKSSRVTADDVVATAARIADEQGLTAVSLTRVARDLGVRQPALYRHVDSIEALWRSVALRAQRALLAQITRAAVGQTRDDAVAAIAVAWRDYVHEHPGTYSTIGRVAIEEGSSLARSSEEIVFTLTLALRGYALSHRTASNIADCIRSALHGFCLLEKDGGYPRPYDINENFGRLIMMLIAGIRGMVAVEAVTENRQALRKADGSRARAARR